MYTVYDKDKPANDTSYELGGEGWQNATFETFEEAVRYVSDWLGNWAPSLSFLRMVLANEAEYDYSGYGDTIQIKEG